MKTKQQVLKCALLAGMLFMLSFNYSNGNYPTRGISSQYKPAKSRFLVKTYKFGELRSGDCVMAAGGTMDVYSDGRAVFNATVWTNHTHSGDTWHHHVEFNNSVGGVLFRITLEGPNHMNDDGTHYAFSSTFNYPAELYEAIATITVKGEC